MIDKEFRAIVKKIKSRIARPVPRTEFDWERVAIDYAKWLAERDKTMLPPPTWGCRPRAIWSGVYSKTRKGAYGRPIFEKRITSVEWGTWDEVYNTRKDGRRGAFSHKDWNAKMHIGLPNWDWQPEVVDTSESDDYQAMAA